MLSSTVNEGILYGIKYNKEWGESCILSNEKASDAINYTKWVDIICITLKKWGDFISSKAYLQFCIFFYPFIF